MTLLASFTDGLSFGVMLIVSVSIPTVGLMVSGATMRRRGLNPWAASSSIVFFLALLVGSVMWVIGGRPGTNEAAVLYALLGCVVLHTVSTLMALRGLAQVRTRRKWAHGRRRVYWVVGLNILVIFLIGAWCYYHVNPVFNDAFGS